MGHTLEVESAKFFHFYERTQTKPTSYGARELDVEEEYSMFDVSKGPEVGVVVEIEEPFEEFLI